MASKKSKNRPEPESGASAGDLIGEIRRQAEAEAEAILKDAREERQAHLKKARHEADQVSAGILDRAENEAQMTRRKIESGVELEKRRAYLEAREAVIREMSRRLSERLVTFRAQKGYWDTLTGWIEEGSAAVDDRQLRLAVGDREREWLDKGKLHGLERSLSEKLGRKVALTLMDSQKDEGGVLVSSEDGRVTFDNRFSARLKRREPEIRRRVMEKLEGVHHEQATKTRKKTE